MPPRKDLQQGDIAARQMFGGSLFQPNFLPRAGRSIASGIGAIGSAVSNFRVGPLIRTGGPQPAERPTPVTATLPSGTPMVGFDAYPTTPQMPATAPTQFPYGSALGPSIYSQTPTQTNLQTGMATAPAPTGFGAINPPAFPQGQQSISRLGLMGGTLSSGQVTPLPLEQVTPMVAGQRPIIESGPVAMTATGTLTPEQRGMQAIKTPYGSIYATQEQAANMGRARTLAEQSSRSPAQQQALLAQMRRQGAAIRQRIGGQQEAFFTQKRAERGAANIAENAARSLNVRPMDIMRTRAATAGPSTIAGIQQQFSSYQPSIGPIAPASFYARNTKSRFSQELPVDNRRPLRSGPMGPSGYALYEQQQAGI